MKDAAVRMPYNNVYSRSALGAILNLTCINIHSKFLNCVRCILNCRLFIGH
jgi:hypothetical protein